jgi:3-isopropylmalate dehydrogenase
LTVSVVLLPGDGVGPEVTTAARRVLDAATPDLEIEYRELLIGGAAIEEHGTPLRQEDVRACRAADAVFMGAVGGPQWDDLPAAQRPERGLLRIRGELGLAINLRPVRAIPAGAARSPLKAEVARGADILFVRELTGGIYFGQPSYYHRTLNGKYAVDTCEYTERQVRPLLEFAFELAKRRRGRVTSVDKANILSTSRLWREVATSYGEENPDVDLEHMLVDSFAMSLMQNPTRYDVVVTENLFGDILTDLAAVLSGSLGVLPSASLRPGAGLRRFGLYEPVHGSAPTIAGQDVANPTGAMLSAALMLELSLGRPGAATVVRQAVSAVMDEGRLTADLAPDGVEPVSTSTFTEAVVDRIHASGGSRGDITLRHHVA